MSDARHTLLDVSNKESNTPSSEHPEPTSLIPMSPSVVLMSNFEDDREPSQSSLVCIRE